MRRQDVTGNIYIAHFDQPLGDTSRPRMTASHYIGWTERDQAQARWDEHLAGRGASIIRAAVNRGIGVRFEVIEQGVTRERERQIKRAGHHDRRCPCCVAS